VADIVVFPIGWKAERIKMGVGAFGMAVHGWENENNTGRRMSRSREGWFSMDRGSVTISNAIMAGVNIIAAAREYCR